jgi:hypothetical protein
MGQKTPDRLARAWRLPVLSLAVLSVMTTGAEAQQQEPKVTGSEAFYVLAREQSNAESYVVLLETVGKDDFRGYADGVRLYAGAKAEFDGLIEQIKQDTIKRVPFDSSEKFQVVLRTAVERRLAFTKHVDEIVEALPPGTRPGIKDYIAAAGELLSAITDAAKTIWEAYWAVQETQRKETLTQLEALKWKAFHEIAKPSG